MPMDINEGDTIIYTKFSVRQEVQHEGEEYSVVTERDIIAVSRKDKGSVGNGMIAVKNAF